MKSLSLALSLLALSGSLHAQQPINQANTWVNQNFDSMGTVATASLPNGWRVGNGKDAIDWSNGLTATTDSAGSTGSGSVSGQGCLNFADGINASATDRALGFLGAEGFLGINVYRTPRSILYAFRNDSGRTVSSLDLEWNYEKYRNGQRTNAWTFFHGSGSSPSTAVVAGDQSYPSDGNTNLVHPPTSVAKSVRIEGLNIAPNATYYLRWAYTGISGDTNSHALGIDDFSIRLNAPWISTQGTPGPFMATFGSPSPTQTITVDGAGLTSPALITAPARFEISSDGADFVSSLSAGGSSLPVTLHIRLAANAPRGSVTGNLFITSDGAAIQMVSLSGSVVYTLTASSSALSGFKASLAAASTAQALTISGSGLSGPVGVTAPSGYEISLAGTAFGSSVSLDDLTGGSLPETTIQVRLAANASLGTLNGNLSITSDGVTPVTVSLAGAVYAVLSPSVASLSGFSSSAGGASAAQSLTLDGQGIVAPIEVSAPEGFEVSRDGVTFGSSVLLGGASGKIASVDRDGSLAGRGNIPVRGSGTEFPNFRAFAAIRPGGSVSAWGDPAFGGDTSGVAARLQGEVKEIYSNGYAFAAVKHDGSVVTWGNPANGGNSSDVAAQLTSGVVKVSSTRRAFAALKDDGSVVCWGALGENLTGYYLTPFSDVSLALQSDVVEIYSASDAFAALKSDGSVVTWGSGYDGGDSSHVAASLASGVVEIVPVSGAFAARKSDGSLVAWGAFRTELRSYIGIPRLLVAPAGVPAALTPLVSSGVAKIFSNGDRFAALKDDGAVVTWGDYPASRAPSPNVQAALESGVLAVFSSRFAMAALKEDGSVVTWGQQQSGGDSSSVATALSEGVVDVFSNNESFAALKQDGSVVTWGNSDFGGLPRKSLYEADDFGFGGYTYESVADDLLSGVVRIQATEGAFAATKSDGSVVVWGGSQYGGDDRQVAANLSSGVSSIHANQLAFVAVKDDGSLVSWGHSSSGPSNAPAQIAGPPLLPATVYVRLAAGGAGGVLSGNLEIKSDGALAQTVSLGGSAMVLSLSTASLSGFEADYGSISPPQVLTLAGSGLSAPVSLRAPAGYEISSTGLEFFQDLVFTLADNGSITPQTIRVRLAAGAPVGVVNGEMEVASTGFPDQVVSLTGEVRAVLHVSTVGLDGFRADFGAASGTQNFTVAGGGLSGPVTITAPAGYHASKNGIDFGPVVTVNGASDGTLAVATLHVRLAANNPVGAVAGDLLIASPGFETRTVALSGTVLPSLFASSSALSGFVAEEGSVSSAKTFTLNGAGFTTPLRLNAPRGYEISLDGVGFSSSLRLGGDPKLQSIFRNRPGAPHGPFIERGSGTEFPSLNAFAAVTSSGSVVAWGNSSEGGSTSSVANALTSDVVEIFSSWRAFAALKNDGSVVTWGSAAGGDSSEVASQLTSGVVSISSTAGSFAALKAEGSVVTWGGAGGNSTAVASSLSSGVVSIHSTWLAFAALKDDGSVVTWGNNTDGGNSSAVASDLSSGVVLIFSNSKAFAALKEDGSVVTWGSAADGGDSSEVAAQLSSGVASITASRGAFAALKSNGSVVAWGATFDGGGAFSTSIASSLASGVVEVFAAGSAFAALKSNGAVVTWGFSDGGGNSSSVSGQLSEVVKIYSSTNAFAALKSDGSVVTWGDSNADAVDLSSGVQSIYSNEGAFAALKTDGSVTVWGSPDFGGDPALSASSLTSGVIAVTANRTAFTALKNDGSIVSWGNSSAGGTGTLTNIGTFTPPSLPAVIHVRMAANTSPATLLGDLSITSSGMRTETVALSGMIGTPPSTTPYEDWVALWFAQNPAFAAAAALPDADPDGDGISNQMEYALGLNPNTSGVIPAALVVDGAQLEYTYTRSTAAREAGLTYQIEWSETLEPGSWTSENVAQQIESTAGALETVKATIPAGNSGRRFLRLRVDSIEN